MYVTTDEGGVRQFGAVIADLRNERRAIGCSAIAGKHTHFTAIRLKVEDNQLVGAFGEIGFPIDGLKGA